MLKLKKLHKYIKKNATELWLGTMLFIGVPVSVGMYTDYRGAIATTVFTQTVVLVLFVYKGNK